MGDIAVVVPFRLGGLTRLAGVLAPPEREQLAIAMLQDVVTALRGAGLEPAIAAADKRTRDRVTDALPDAACLLDPPGSQLDDCVAAHAAANPHGLLVVMADLPALEAHDVSELLGIDADVVIAETSDGGTGALLRRPADAIPTAYGPGSARRHERMAIGAGRTCARVRLAGLQFEIDCPKDLERRHEQRIGPATKALLG